MQSDLIFLSLDLTWLDSPFDLIRTGNALLSNTCLIPPALDVGDVTKRKKTKNEAITCDAKRFERVQSVFKISSLNLFFFPPSLTFPKRRVFRAVTQMQSVHCAICSSPSNFSALIPVMFSHISDCRSTHIKQKWLHLPATATAARLWWAFFSAATLVDAEM